MTITREQFMCRVQDVSVAFYVHHKGQWKMLYIHSNRQDSPLIIYLNIIYDFFQYNHKLYSFDELDQFLIDKGIVEPKFDVHTYLLSNGYSKDWHGYHHPSASYKICIQNDLTEVSKTYRDRNTWAFDGITKESCDKAMGLIKYLESIE